MRYGNLSPALIISVALTFFVLTLFFKNNRKTAAGRSQKPVPTSQTLGHRAAAVDLVALKLVEKQRDEVSRILNSKMKEIGLLQCEKVAAQQRSVNQTGFSSSLSGTYCDHGKSYHVSDDSLVNYLKDFFKGKRVASFGEGPGQYKKKLDPYCECYDGFDGSPTVENFTNYSVRFLDLSVSQFGLKNYDYVLSMEVAEHIPKQFESIFLDNVVRFAEVGVILSWAKPGQGGQDHVNNQPASYAIDQLKLRGFIHDEVISKAIKDAASVGWLKDNLNYYYRAK